MIYDKFKFNFFKLIKFNKALEIYFAPSVFKLLLLLFLYFIIYDKFKLKLFKFINYTTASEICFVPSTFTLLFLIFYT